MNTLTPAPDHFTRERAATFRRMLIILRRLERGHGESAKAWGREFGVCSRTIRRDVDFLREELGARIDYDRSRGRYVLLEKLWL